MPKDVGSECAYEATEHSGEEWVVASPGLHQLTGGLPSGPHTPEIEDGGHEK